MTSMSIKDALITLAGDLHSVPGFPWFSYATRKHKVAYDEAIEGMQLAKFGDIGLHRDSGYLSNFFIPGFMKHAWVHTEDGVNGQVVEAISEGVVKRSAMYPIYSDYSIILRPKDVTEEDRKGACVKANGIVGEKYDFDFHFDIEAELKHYNGQLEADAANELKDAEKGLQKKHAFSCTEVASYAWWHQREKLQLYRTKQFGRSIITADMFMNRGWEIRWASESVTADSAKRLGLSEEGLSLVEDCRR